MDPLSQPNPMMQGMGSLPGGPPGMPGQPPPQPGMMPDPQSILQQILQGPLPQGPPKDKNRGKKLEVKDEKKNTTPATPQGKLEKARDMIKAVVNELGAQSETSAALSGLVRNLDMQIKKMGGMNIQENQINGMGDQGQPPLGIGAPNQQPEEGGSSIMSPQSLPTNLSGNF